MLILVILDITISSNNTNIATKENMLSFTFPLIRTNNNKTIDLSAYPLKTYVDGSLNTINSTIINEMKILHVYLH